MAKKIVKCLSGEIGIRQRVREIYEDYEEFLLFNRMYNMHTRLNFPSARSLWEENPIIEGSSNPSDFRVYTKEKKKV